MRCKSCDYPLWGIVERRCPECGEGFVPSDFEFVPNAVQFCCPDCGQEYYGTGVRGALEPRAFTCVSCKRPLTMDQMVVRSVDGVDADRAVASSRLPWHRRSEIGSFNAWWKTLGLSLGKPVGIGSRLGVRAEVGSALWFYLRTLVIIIALGSAPLLVLTGIGMTGSGVNVGAVLGMIALVFGSMVASVVFALLWVGIGHGFFVLLGGGGKGGIGRTAEAVLYGSGSQIVMAVPCCGIYAWFVPLVWWPISTGMIFAQAHRVGWLRATAVALVGPAIAFLSVGGFVAWGLYNVGVAQQGIAGSAAVGASQIHTTYSSQRLLSSLNSWVVTSGGLPDHLLELDVAQTDPQVFRNPGGYAVSSPIVITDGVSFDDVSSMENQERNAFFERTIDRDRMLVAHRVGDVVSTWRGVPVASDGIRLSGDGVVQAGGDEADGLWLFLLSESPTLRGAEPRFVHAGTRGAGVLEIAWADFPRLLEEQNGLRDRVAGLAALPHPDSVR